MNIKQLKQNKADLAAKLAKVKAEGWKLGAVAAKDRTPEQASRLTAIDTEIAAINDEIAENAAELARAERYLADAAGGPSQIALGENREAQAPWGPQVPANASTIVQAEARQLALGNFALAVRAAGLGHGMDVRLQAAATGAGTQSDSNLGFAIPHEVAPGIEREMYEGGEVMGRCDIRTIGGNAISYNRFDETSRADSSRQGGVLGYWVDEGTAPTASNTKLDKLELKLRKVGAFGVMTDELLSDAQALGGELEQAFARELIFQVENKIWRGNGANAPQGFLNGACLVSVAKETSQAAATINGKNLSKMWARMPASSKKNAVWFINVDVEPQLDELSIAVGTAALEPRFVRYNEQGILTIKGRPVIPVEYAETLGTQGDIALVDMSRYRLIRKGGIEQASSMHVYFAQGEQAFRAFYRVDGKPVPKAAITPFKGSGTLSPFVVLDTRS
jgi:HK97 family phage major capsid protein